MTSRGRALALVVALALGACSGSADTSSSRSSGSTATSTTSTSTSTTTSTTTTTTTTTTVVAEPEPSATTHPPTTEPPATDPPSTEPPPTTANPFVPTSVNVYMPDRTFFPSKPIIASGGTVTWSNSSQEVHNVVSDSFSSGEVAPGGSYSAIMGAPGVYSYRCTFHPEMTGQIDVR